MGTMLEVDHVEGIDLEKVRQALWLLHESGLPATSMQHIRYEFQTSQCTNCKQHWPRHASPVHSFPTWQYQWDRGRKPEGLPPKSVRKKLSAYLEGYENLAPRVPWRNAETCESCLLVVADALGEFVASLPKMYLNAFCRMYSITIKCTKSFNEDRSYRAWSRSREYAGYVALTNAFLQHVPPQGNARAVKLLVDAAHELGLL